MDANLEKKDIPFNLKVAYDSIRRKKIKVEKALSSLKDLEPDKKDALIRYYGYDIIEGLRRQRDQISEKFDNINYVIDNNLYPIIAGINVALREINE